MNCANHPEAAAAAYCRDCGKALCGQCLRPAMGTVFCDDHRPAVEPPPLPADPPAFSAPPAGFAGSPYAASAVPPAAGPRSAAPVADPEVHPLLALLLGFIPGVGAIYNGQYAKGLIHAVIFGLMVSALTNMHNGGAEAFIGIMLATWVIYQPFEAYHTARKRRYGLVVEEFSSLIENGPRNGKFPMGAVLLIGLGFVLLLDTTDIITMDQIEKYWPIALILAGLYMLYSRFNPGAGAGHERESDAGARQ